MYQILLLLGAIAGTLLLARSTAPQSPYVFLRETSTMASPCGTCGTPEKTGIRKR